MRDLVIIINENRAKFDAWYKGKFPIAKEVGENYVMRIKKVSLFTVHKSNVQLVTGE